MTNTAMLTVRTDPKVKKAAQKAARELGVPLSVVVNASLRDFVRERRVELGPFVPNVRTARLLDAALKEPVGKIYATSEEMFADLDK